MGCCEPPVVPEGWVFEPLRGDRFVVVCRPGHPLARARAPSMKALSAYRWLLLPASLSARKRFDELLERFPASPATYPIVTRSAPMLWQLLQQQDLLALLPLNLVRPLLEAGRLVHLRGGDAHPLAPIGALRPASGLAPAAATLCDALRVHAAEKRP